MIFSARPQSKNKKLFPILKKFEVQKKMFCTKTSQLSLPIVRKHHWYLCLDSLFELYAGTMSGLLLGMIASMPFTENHDTHPLFVLGLPAAFVGAAITYCYLPEVRWNKLVRNKSLIQLLADADTQKNQDKMRMVAQQEKVHTFIANLHHIENRIGKTQDSQRLRLKNDVTKLKNTLQYMQKNKKI